MRGCWGTAGGGGPAAAVHAGAGLCRTGALALMGGVAGMLATAGGWAVVALCPDAAGHELQPQRGSALWAGMGSLLLASLVWLLAF